MDLSPDEENFQGRLLHQAALWDNLELLEELLSNGAAVNARDGCQRTALHGAALAERSRCLAALCAAGADLDGRCDISAGGKTALHVAAERGHAENVRTLVKAGASLDVLDAAGRTALELAEQQRHRHAALALREATDAQERERLSRHAELRELILRGANGVSPLRTKLTEIGRDAELVVNLSTGGAHTLLYLAAEAGQPSAVSALLAAGADLRAHPATKYTPLYIACHRGRIEAVRLLLAHNPQAVQHETLEKWLPLHAACIGGHADIVTLLLDYPYPPEMLMTFVDALGKWRYMSPFDVNARDARGHTALYAASALGDLAVLNSLLEHFVPATRIRLHDENEDQPQSTASSVASPHRGGISFGIHAIVSRLTGANQQHERPPDTYGRVRPVRTDLSCAGDTCVGVATRSGHLRVLQRLLAAGADPDALSLPPSDLGSSVDGIREERRSRSASAVTGRASPSSLRSYNSEREEISWTALGVAACAGDVPSAEALLSHGATDSNGLALRECARRGLTSLYEKLLATRAYPDPDNKVNKAALTEQVFGLRDERDRDLSYSALCPASSVAINWRDLRAHLDKIRVSWLRAGCVRVNASLSSNRAALHALTRLDISGNELRLLPRELFSLLSLRYLNAAQNKLERLPIDEDLLEDEIDTKGRRNKKKFKRPELYSAPVLQELFLQDNRLEEIPGALFSLRSLATLDVSNNKLRTLPAEIWSAPALKDLNVALNHLRDLPTGPQVECIGVAQGSSPAKETSQTANSSSRIAQNASTLKPSLRRSSTEDTSEDTEDEDGEGIPFIGDRSGNAVWSEARRAHAWRTWWECGPIPPPPTQTSGGSVSGGGAISGGGSRLASLNLSHNQFTCIPPVLACRATSLTRLNMAYNSLRSMSYVTSYPASLRQLDLSHNEITCWPSLPQIEKLCSAEEDPLACYCPSGPKRSSGGCGNSRPRSGCSVRAQLLGAACPARRHLRLEGLRTLILANNLLTRIQLTTDDDGEMEDSQTPSTGSSLDNSQQDDDEEWDGNSVRGRLLFPMLSMLDVSCNLLRNVPSAIRHLTNLAVLNISGNREITELPPSMGLLSRLWNLNASGCELAEPLRSMLRSPRYKTMDVVGYLKSVLQEARPYTAMKLMLVGLQGIGKTSLLECLRQESAIHHRRKPTEHWAKRMGNKATAKGNLSTVGVDIGLWVYEKQRSSRGPVTFRTWDFGGQQEYYATHQYFLSRRSLYLVVWNVTDGKRGLAAALDWLRSIQARAPGSPVIMVATHYDQVSNCNLPESECPESLQRLIRSSIMGAPDADKMGLPRVLDSVEVSCSTRHNIRLLADIIYSVAFSVKPPGCKEPLLEQKVPATYLALEECVISLATSSDLREPVLRHADYKRRVTQYLQQKGHRMFRDAAELHQATMFLHENGVLLHYDDATLKQLYFLRPQWLCDVLAHVLAVREVNPFANGGIMQAEDLAHVFKASPLLGEGSEARALALSLLNKFELALCWGQRVLLVPPLLPLKEPPQPQLSVRARSWGGARRAFPSALPAHLAALDQQPSTDSPALLQEEPAGVSVSARSAGVPLRRLVLLSYVPQGFWPRLTTRLLADPALAHAPSLLYRLAPEIEAEESISRALELPWGWKLWRSGVAMCAGPLTLLVLRELRPARDALLGELHDDRDTQHPYADIKVRLMQEGAWCSLELASSACVELMLPSQQCVLRRGDGLPLAGYQSISVEPNPETLAKVLALLSDHVDLLLEDWYPSLGTRFVHTSEGRCLITRVVPCPSCLRDVHHDPNDHNDPLAQDLRELELDVEEDEVLEGAGREQVRLSADSRTSDRDSGVGADSNPGSRIGSVEGGLANAVVGRSRLAYGWTVEELILAACTNKRTGCACSIHGPVPLTRLAPDLLFLDVEECKRARWEQVSRGTIAGRGAFGTVVSARWRRPGSTLQVAVKALQPVPGAEPTAQHRAAIARWERDPAGAACRAYCALRQELCILTALHHPHVLVLEAVCAAPLALLLELAPQGALDAVLREYRSCGVPVGPRTARALLLQVARALEYLHAQRILYRDLKSENVLVWRLPRPRDSTASELSAAPIDVFVKLGDYGISRLAPPSGTKGFGGTEGFMAPEIMRYNGEEEYNEKVDCFSYGMLIYEIVTCRQPFEGHEAVKDAILEGARPTLTPREAQFPCCVLETMRRCWSGSSEARPSAGALVSLAAAPECASLADAAHSRRATAAAGTPLYTDDGNDSGQVSDWEVWFGGGEPERLHSLAFTRCAFTHQHALRVPPEKADPVLVTALSRVGTTMWVGDSAGRLTVYNIGNCEVRWSARVAEAVGECGIPPPSVSALRALPELKRVAVALSCGRLFLVTSRRPDPETGFVLTELGAATSLCCLVAVRTPRGYEVWAGGDALYAYGVQSNGVCGADKLESGEDGRVSLLAAEEDEPYVFACREPGARVVQYCAVSKRIGARLDCGKLAPCSESLQSICIEEQSRYERGRVTALCAVGGKLFAGTAGGCLVVADAATLRPLTVCRPYERDVQAIVPLLATGDSGALVVTIGEQYRPLHERYAPRIGSSKIPLNGHYALLWRAHHWLPD